MQMIFDRNAQYDHTDFRFFELLGSTLDLGWYELSNIHFGTPTILHRAQYVNSMKPALFWIRRDSMKPVFYTMDTTNSLVLSPASTIPVILYPKRIHLFC